MEMSGASPVLERVGATGLGTRSVDRTSPSRYCANFQQANLWEKCTSEGAAGVGSRYLSLLYENILGSKIFESLST